MGFDEWAKLFALTATSGVTGYLLVKLRGVILYTILLILGIILLLFGASLLTDFNIENGHIGILWGWITYTLSMIGRFILDLVNGAGVFAIAALVIGGLFAKFYKATPVVEVKDKK